MRLKPIVAFVHMALCGFLRVDVKSFTMEVVTNMAWHRKRAEFGEISGTSTPTIQFREEQQLFEETTTVEPSYNCRFRFPEQKHVYGLLSDMMNQLARVFVKTDVFISRQVSKQTRKLYSVAEVRRALATRFKLARDRRKTFFDDLLNNMTTEYSKLFNMSESQQAASCPPQDSARARWRSLLRTSGAMLSAAERACAALYLAERGLAAGSWLAGQLDRHVTKEIRLIEARQLQTLCRDFNLCYQNDFSRFPLPNGKKSTIAIAVGCYTMAPQRQSF